MFKVVCVVDKEGTALDRLAQGVKKYHDRVDYQVVAVHPKRPDAEQLQAFEQAAMDADVIDWQYFRTAEMLRAQYSWLDGKKHILTHNNPYSIEEGNWNNYDINVGNNLEIYNRLKELTAKPVEYIPLTVDTDFWAFNPDWKFKGNYTNGSYNWNNETQRPSVILVANRIEGKKGILPAIVAAAELNLKIHLVGAISDANYMHSIMQASNNIEFHERISDEELRELYYKSTIHICNSVDNFESGTLPILEAMLCGVPVLTRKIGHVPDIFNGENMVIHEGSPEDVEMITHKLKEMLFDKKKLEVMREKAWNSAKGRSFERRAHMYQKLYRQVMYPESVPVSIVTPIYEGDTIVKCLEAISNQTYPNIELVIADDGNNKDLIEKFKNYVNYPIKYINTRSVDNDYGLARARNEATIEATGEIIVYCDQRMIMETQAVEQFVHNMKPKTWLYGNKGTKKEFVENFSAVYRKEVIEAGMFNERINEYGGQSQEVRSRIRAQGFQIEFIDGAKCTPSGKSSNRWKKRDQIIRMKNKLWKMELE